ncbi:MAG: TIGR03435 family protein [Acidobacteriaceae bacterium]
MNSKPSLAALLLGVIAAASCAQTAPAQSASAAAASLPAFATVTVKPVDPKGGGMVGFYCYPGGRVVLSYVSIKMLLNYAYDVKDYQISGEPDWADAERYDIEAEPPDSSPSRNLDESPFATAPTAEQKQMLQSLLRDRFALKFHMETRPGDVYILSRGSGKLQLDKPKDPDMDWRGNVVNKGGIFDGEAFGYNISMADLAAQLSHLLGLPVLDQTGLTRKYDFHLEPDTPENRDKEAAAFDAMHRLGLDLKKGKGSIETLVVDHIEKPSEN